MRRLILMRHAKSDWDNADLYDHNRPLNKRGRASATALGEWLRAKDYLPVEVLCSSSLRTSETLKGLKLDPQTKTAFIRRLYHASADTMLDVLKAATGDTVLMIGHNPGICDFAARLLDVAPDHPRFDDYPTGATLVADFDIADWQSAGFGRARAVDFVVPRDLTG